MENDDIITFIPDSSITRIIGMCCGVLKQSQQCEFISYANEIKKSNSRDNIATFYALRDMLVSFLDRNYPADVKQNQPKTFELYIDNMLRMIFNIDKYAITFDRTELIY